MSRTLLLAARRCPAVRGPAAATPDDDRWRWGCSAGRATWRCSTPTRAAGAPDLALRGQRVAAAGPELHRRRLRPPQRPFPLSSDPEVDPNQADTGVDRDENGWPAWARPTRVRLRYKPRTARLGTAARCRRSTRRPCTRSRATQRHVLVEQGGQPRRPADGTGGCCSRDGLRRFQNRGKGQPSGPHQAVTWRRTARRATAVDWNGDVWVATAPSAGSRTVTKIANDLASCSERNGRAGIQTSADGNGDGVIARLQPATASPTTSAT